MGKYQACLYKAIISLFLAAGFVIVYTNGTCSDGKCSATSRFLLGENMADGYALIGHVFQNISVAGVLNCYMECQPDCRCISFNFLTNAKQDNCQLNEENRHLQPDALKPIKGSQYYDLVIDYRVKTGASSSPCTQCTNRCCSDHPCVNGGTCREICETNGKRFICDCPVGFIGQLCQKDCREALGMESGKISNGQITASSVYNAVAATSRSRLHTSRGWAPKNSDIDEWLQVDLGSPNMNVAGIATQGDSQYTQYVTSYTLQYSDDEVNFLYYEEQEYGTDKVFAGNTDRSTVVYHDLNPPIRARYIRFRALTWRNWIVLRMELYGCEVL